MQTEALLRIMSDVLARIATPADISLASDPTAFTNTMASWLTDPDFHLPNGSIVGLICSSLLGLLLQEEEEEGTGPRRVDGLITDYRRFLLATSLALPGWRDGSGVSGNGQLRAAGQVAGCRLVRHLDRVVTPQFLARCGRESCQVLFLLVLGATLGAGYSSSPPEDPLPELPVSDTLSPEFQKSPTLWLAMKEHLCQMLARHLIFIGSKIGIRLETGLEQRIIDIAASRWNKTEEYLWANLVGSGRNPRSSALTSAELTDSRKEEAGDAAPQYRKATGHAPQGSPTESTRLVPMRCPEASDFPAKTVDNWLENPESYLSMFEGPEVVEPSGVGMGPGQPSPPRVEVNRQRGPPEPPRPSGGKRRSIWLVRPFDAGPGQGVVSMHARLSGKRGTDSPRMFP